MTGALADRESSRQPFRCVISPNGSLSARGAAVFVAAAAAPALGIAGWLAWLGAWLVLPFAGLELLCLALALIHCLRANRYREIIEVTDDKVSLIWGENGPEQSLVFDRYWSRVALVPATGRERRLLLCCRGRSVEVGRCLTQPDRIGLGRRLDEVIGPLAA